MPQLIKNIEAEFIDDTIGSVICLNPIIGEIQQSDYINLNGFIAFMQDYSKVYEITQLKKPITFGLVNKFNLPIISLEINQNE